MARGFNAARGFVGGAAISWCISQSGICGFNAARGYSLSPPPPLRGPLPRSRRGGLVTLRFLAESRNISFPRRCGGSGERSEPIGALMPHAALFVVQRRTCPPSSWSLPCFNAARGFVGVVQQVGENLAKIAEILFQCRTRLCGWCSLIARSPCPPRGKKPFWKVSTVLCDFAAHPHDVPFRSLHRLYHSRDYAK